MSHVRVAVFAGLVYGVLMGGFFAFQALMQGRSWTLVAVTAAGTALGCGLLFGLAMYGFGRLPAIRRQIELQPGDLLPGETLLHSTACNLLVKPQDFGLRNFALGDLLFLAGMKDKEAIGGMLHVTDLRLLFKSHRFNRLHGAISIFLPSIAKVEDTSRWPWQAIRVTTQLAQVGLVTRGVPALLRCIERARNGYGATQSALLEPMRRALPGVESLQPNVALNTLNTVIHHGRLGQNIVDAALTPLAALAGLFASEVFDRTLAERWSKRMQR